MKNWIILLKKVLLSNNIIDNEKTNFIKNELLDYNDITSENISFLSDLKNESELSCNEFIELYYTVFEMYILSNDVIDENKIHMINKYILSDKLSLEYNKNYLMNIKSKVSCVCPEFLDAYSKILNQ